MKKIAGILKDFFALHQQKVFQATAPGRLDIMGGNTDLAGGLLLQKPLDSPTTAYLAISDTPAFRWQLYVESEKVAEFETDYASIIGEFPTLNYDFVREQVLSKENSQLALPIIAITLLFFESQNIKAEGIDLIIATELPLKQGVGTQASIEIATLKALADAYSCELGADNLPSLALQAENVLVTNPTGGGAQFASYFSKHHTLTVFRASPPEIFHPIEVPDTIQFIGIGTGIDTTFLSESYEIYRASIFMGYTIIALASGASLRDLEVAFNTNNRSSLPYRGNVGEINPSEFEDKFLPLLPDSLSGDEFYQQYKYSIDQVAFIDRDKTYSIRNCTKHPVYENFRVKLFAQILKNYSTEFQDYSNRLNLLGELMYQSHQSYTECGLGNDEANHIVRRVKEIGGGKGLFGARITDAGNGGVVSVLASGIAGPEKATQLRQELEQEFQKPLAYFV
ncbi:MAG: hypothetical protein AAF992_20205 [Bacteroidota bacterium]